MLYDVAIAGGGIAGLSLAIDLRRRGYKIVVLEKGSYPRHKVCGEYISMESADYLKKICPELITLALPRINTFRLTAPGNNVFETHLQPGGFGISRYLLEQLLYKEALKNGVEVLTDQKVQRAIFSKHENLFTVKGNSVDIHSKFFCNASGKISNLVKWKTMRQDYIAVKYHITTDRETNKIEIHNFNGGYCGISNIENEKSCLCYIVNTDQLKSTGNSIEQLEKKYLFKNESLNRIFKNSKFLFERPLVTSGINFTIKDQSKDNNFYIGDSAGTVSPVTGNGMSMSLRSASFLAEQIDHCLNEKINQEELTKRYRHFWNKQFASRIKLSGTLQSLTESTFLAQLSIKTFNVFPSVARFLIRQTHGKPF